MIVSNDLGGKFALERCFLPLPLPSAWLTAATQPLTWPWLPPAPAHLLSSEAQLVPQERQLLLWRILGGQKYGAAAHHSLECIPLNAQLLQGSDAGAKHLMGFAA
jgi:hypothetical protein